MFPEEDEYEHLRDRLYFSSSTPTLVLYYYPILNRFIDEDGYVIEDIFRWFEPWYIQQWKNQQDYGILQTRSGEEVEVYYLEPEVEDHVLSHQFLLI